MEHSLLASIFDSSTENIRNIEAGLNALKILGEKSLKMDLLVYDLSYDKTL